MFHGLTCFGHLRRRTTSCWRKMRFSASSRAQRANRDRIPNNSWVRNATIGRFITTSSCTSSRIGFSGGTGVRRSPAASRSEELRFLLQRRPDASLIGQECARFSAPAEARPHRSHLNSGWAASPIGWAASPIWLACWVLYFSTIVSDGRAPAADSDAAGYHPSSDTGEPLRHAMACPIIAPLGRIPSHGSGALCRREGR
jgi:hypothetical protein